MSRRDKARAYTIARIPFMFMHLAQLHRAARRATRRPHCSALIYLSSFAAVCGCLSGPAIVVAADPAGKTQDKAQEKSEKAREKMLKTIEAKLGKKDEGKFVVLFKTVQYELVANGPHTQVVPRPKFEVSTSDGRRAAAESVFEFLSNGQDTVQKYVMTERGGGRRDASRRPLPPPTFNWQMIGRYEKEDDAIKAADDARKKFEGQAPSKL